VVHNAPPLQDSRGVIYEPVRTPTTVARIEDPPPPVGSIPGFAREGIERLSALIGRAVPAEAIAPAPVAVVEKTPAPLETVTPRRVRSGGNVVAAQPLRRVEPVYPEIAVRTRVSGKVELEGVIGIDGRIHELRAVSGSPLLIRAALDAVRQWVYKPLTLNGEPVEVVQSIVVNFNLK
jgi:protein TonB